ncbi:LysR family transcriptional regulator [Paraburkholderia flava]|uniref:LysR family transcriptional regulator n=1 Tax=Paraburkholderia flava TaxID=2547393 RepID=UPI00105C31D5|nr:LysR family transcriptional regulator [Paraburkholderia flava]
MDKFTAMHTLVNVVNAGTFARAADLMNVPASTVTRLVQTLEKDLKVKLLHRTTRRLTLTQEGIAYYEGAVRVLDEVGALESSVMSASKAPEGRIRVELAGSVAFNRVIPRLPEFYALYPDIQIDMTVGNRTADLLAESVDCVVRIGPLLSDSLIARSLGTLSLATCASPQYLQTHGTPLHPSELAANHRLIKMTSTHSGRDFVFSLRQGEEQFELKGKYQLSVNDSSAALVAGLAGLGVLTTYAFMIQPYIESGALQGLFPEWRGDRIPVHIAYPVNRHLAQKVRVFIDWVASLFPPEKF